MHCDNLASFSLFLKLCEDFSLFAFAQASMITTVLLLGKYLKTLLFILFANLADSLFMIACNLRYLLITQSFIAVFQHT